MIANRGGGTFPGLGSGANQTSGPSFGWKNLSGHGCKILSVVVSFRILGGLGNEISGGFIDLSGGVVTISASRVDRGGGVTPAPLDTRM